MKFAILIQARTGSKRYPEKILKKIDHRVILEFMIDSLLTRFSKNNIIIATTKSKRDNKIIKILKEKKIKYFRGSEQNVLKRYIFCAKKFSVKNIIQLTSDCPLVDVNLIYKMKKIFFKKKLEYFSNTYPPNKSTFPDGTDIEIYKYNSLLRLNKLSNKNEDKEHVTNFFWKNPKLFKTMILKNKYNFSSYKFSIDYKNELKLLRKILYLLKKKKLKPNYLNIVKIIKKNKDLKKISDKNLKKFKLNRKDLVV
jgi:spore coat polysaccharide biosynthesis protein SpsF (cytidylyltransferase family)|tara:strand:- start:1270 stop:2028 length:759 start_codon:yes stop_codon:yes gene_type:complete